MTAIEIPGSFSLTFQPLIFLFKAGYLSLVIYEKRLFSFAFGKFGNFVKRITLKVEILMVLTFANFLNFNRFLVKLKIEV